MHAAEYLDEQKLKQTVCRLKAGHQYSELAAYLAGIATGGAPPHLLAKIHNELGLAHLRLGDQDQAAEAFQTASRHDPQAVNPLFNLGNVFLDTRRYDRALSCYNAVLELDPDHAGARYHAGLCHAQAERPDEALDCFEQAARLAPEAIGPLFWAAETLLAGGRYSRALPYFRKVLELEPRHRESRRGEAICLLELKDYAACIGHCDELIASGGGSEYLALRIKGDALIGLGQPRQAALCHCELARLDFDARHYLALRSRELARTSPAQAAVYEETVRECLNELDRDFLGIAFDC